jgi:hypothetical protein
MTLPDGGVLLADIDNLSFSKSMLYGGYVMKSSGFRRLLAGAAVAAAVAFPAVDSGAVVYSSSFDPPNFSGVATFDVADACLVTDGVKTNGVGGCTITWLTAEVTFQDISHTFDYSHLLADSGIVSEILVSGGDLAGVRSGVLGPAFVSGFGSPYDGPWWIQYDHPALGSSDFIGVMQEGLGVVHLFTGDCEGEFCDRNDTPSETADVHTFTRVTAVPEPGTIALILAALTGGWWTRRRLGAAA